MKTIHLPWAAARRSRNEINSLSSIRWRRGLGRGGAFVWLGFPLSSILSPLLRRGERKKTRSKESSRAATILSYCTATRSLLALLVAICVTAGCSIKRMAVNKLGDALAGGGTTFASDDDPELGKAAVPFSLKLMESLLVESPKYIGLLFAASSGFTQYAYAFVR